MITWVFLRHGESVANAARVLSGWNDVALTDAGLAQARAAGAAMAQHRFDRAIASDLQRAHRTAGLALEAWAKASGHTAPALELDARLRERNLGGWQGLGYDTLQQRGDSATLTGWATRPPGGESLEDLAWRTVAALMVLESERMADTILVVAHGGVVRSLLGLIDGTPRDEIGKNKVANAVPHARRLSAGHWAECFAELEAAQAG